MYLLFLFLTSILTVSSIIITVRTQPQSNKPIQIYPSLKPYYKYSCMCLTNINLEMTSDFLLMFTQLSPGSTLYLQINHPPYLQYQEIIQNTEINYSQIVHVNRFNTTGFQTVLYFQQTISNVKSQHWVYFTITNTTQSSEANLMINEVDNSYFILVILTSVITIFFGRFTKIYRFMTISIKWYYFLIYCVATTVYLNVLYFAPRTVGKYFQLITVGFIGLETIGACGFRYKIRKIYVRDIIAVVMAVAIITFWIILGNNWIMNNIIGLLIIGSIVKFVKMTSVKMSLAFFIVVLSFNVTMILILTFTNFSIGHTLINDFPSPLELQIPTLDFFYSRRCTWVEITDMILPGFLLNYARRVDISFNFNIYSILCYIAIVLSAGIQISIYKLVQYQIELPQAIFSIPLILLMFFLVSARRGEWSIIWHGGFYDKTVERTSLMRSVEWDRITQTLDEGLLVN